MDVGQVTRARTGAISETRVATASLVALACIALDVVIPALIYAMTKVGALMWSVEPVPPRPTASSW